MLRDHASKSNKMFDINHYLSHTYFLPDVEQMLRDHASRTNVVEWLAHQTRNS